MTETTKERIVTAAESLFARNGYAATSLRNITEAAGVNIAAVNYHFGSKENLLFEILDRVVGPINSERLRLLDEIEADGEPEVAQVLRAFLLPDLEVLERLRARDPILPRFVSRMYSEGSDLMNEVIGRQFANVQERFHVAFSRALPSLPGQEIAWRLQCVVGIVVYLFAGVEVPGEPAMVGPDIEADVDRLLTIIVPLMSAPLPEEVAVPES